MCYPVGMSALDTYAPDRIGYRYGTPDSAYSKGYHRGQDVRKLNEAGTASVVTDVEAIDDGVVVYVGRPNGLLARTVVIDTGRARGRYESHSHMADISVGVGQRVSSGDRLGRNASMDEDHGFIDGVHDHVTITDRFDGAWATWLGEYDPLPYMEAAYQRAREGANDMGTLDNTEENYQTFMRWLQRAFKFDVRTDGAGPDWRLGPTVFELLRAADDSGDVAGVKGAVSAIAVKMTDEDRAAIAKSVSDSIKIPTGGASKADVAAAIDAGLAKLVLKPATS